jgi:hypothetical protein
LAGAALPTPLRCSEDEVRGAVNRDGTRSDVERLPSATNHSDWLAVTEVIGTQPGR